MSNIVPLDNITLPAHLMNRKAANDVFAAGLPQGGGFPTIGLKGTRFVVRADGAETALPSLEIAVVLLSAKPNLDKTYYASKFDPNATEAKSPDCFSKDGQRPDPSSVIKQAESCAGCPMNQFGSGVGADGSPSKGKACSDTKMLAIFANNNVYGFKVPPASLKAFTNYVKETSRRGVDLTTAITVIGFDPNFSFPVLTFNFGGFLGEAQINKIDSLKGSAEVADIIGGVASVAVEAPKPAVAVEAPKPAPAPAADPFAAAPAVTADPFADAPAAEEKPKKVRQIKPVPAPAQSDMSAEEAELAAALGLDL